MNKITWILPALLVAISGAGLAATAPSQAGPVEVDVRSAGAAGDGATDDTAAIQKAIEKCRESGGGVVRFGAGRYVSGTIMLKDNTRLRLDNGAALLGSTNAAEYALVDSFRSGNGARMGYCLVGAVDAKNVGIDGGGEIDGRGKEFMAARGPGSDARPFLVRFVRCAGVSVKEVQMHGPAAWTMHLSQCRDVIIEKVTIRSRGLSNNDGVDIDSSQDVRVIDCDVDSGDDAVCLKTTSLTPCRNIEVSGCRLSSHWAGIKFGTESVADFENITIHHCVIHDTQGGGIKLFSVDGANVKNVTVSDIQMENVTMPIFIRLGARLKTFRAGDPKQAVGSISNVTIRNAQATTGSPIGVLISGIPGHDVREVTLENITLRLPGGGTREDAAVALEEKEAAYPEITMFGRRMPAYGLMARHVNGLKASGVKLESSSPDLRPAVVCEDVEKLVLSGWDASVPGDSDNLIRLASTRDALITGFVSSGAARNLLRVEGENSQAITLEKNRVAGVQTPYELGKEVKQGAVQIKP